MLIEINDVIAAPHLRSLAKKKFNDKPSDWIQAVSGMGKIQEFLSDRRLAHGQLDLQVE